VSVAAAWFAAGEIHFLAYCVLAYCLPACVHAAA
jgi:hypothetical protein